MIQDIAEAAPAGVDAEDLPSNRVTVVTMAINHRMKSTHRMICRNMMISSPRVRR